MMRYGIDISDCQGIINWPKVKAAGVEFAILRSTRGSGKPDNYLPSNIKGCKEQNIPFDFYKYSYAMNETQAKEEAKRVVEVLKGYGILPNKDTRIWLDMEYDKQLALGKSKCMDIMIAFRNTITAAGYGYGIYMGKYAYENQIDAKAIEDDVWIARYPDTSSRTLKAVPAEKYKPVSKGKSKLWGWQFTSKGTVPGISGAVDLDVCYFDITEKDVEAGYYKTPEFTLIDCLNKISVDSSYANRRRIAEANGIEGYKGTEEQNLRMLDLLNKGKLVKC